jgi:hypothetical protein
MFDESDAQAIIKQIEAVAPTLIGTINLVVQKKPAFEAISSEVVAVRQRAKATLTIKDAHFLLYISQAIAGGLKWMDGNTTALQSALISATPVRMNSSPKILTQNG